MERLREHRRVSEPVALVFALAGWFDDDGLNSGFDEAVGADVCWFVDREGRCVIAAWEGRSSDGMPTVVLAPHRPAHRRPPFGFPGGECLPNPVESYSPSGFPTAARRIRKARRRQLRNDAVTARRAERRRQRDMRALESMVGAVPAERMRRSSLKPPTERTVSK